MPFISGIILANVFSLTCPTYISLIIISAILLSIVAFVFVKQVKWMSFLLYDLFFICLAFMLVSEQDQSESLQTHPQIFDVKAEQIYTAYISEIPVKKVKSVKCQMQIFQVFAQNKWVSYRTEIIAYIKDQNIYPQLLPGRILQFRGKLKSPDGPLNPLVFDYRQYLKHKHLYFTSYITPNALAWVDETKFPPFSLQLLGLKIKYNIVKSINASNLSANAKAICAALLTGYDDDIDSQVMNAFARSGTLHVLSVSGLHTGLIYVMLNFIFNLFDPKNKLKRSRFFTVTAILWFFAVITGFSAPVLRAVLMFNFLGVAKLIKRKSAMLNVNVLLLTAFILLMYNPDFIYDIGFLLSYFAMIGIMIFAPPMLRAQKFKNKILLYIYESAVVSVAATISTLPLTLYYFKQFPIWFALCNLAVVPLSFLILMLTFLPVFHVMFLNTLISYLVQFMIYFISVFNQSIDHIDFELMDMIFLSLFILLAYNFIGKRRYSAVFTALVLLLFWQSYSLFVAFHKKEIDLFVVYSLRGQSIVMVKNNQLVLYNQCDSSAFQYQLKSHLISLNYPTVVYRPFNYLTHKKSSLLILNKEGCLPQVSKISVNQLLIANNYPLNNEFLQSFKNVHKVIVDGSNRSEIIKQTENLCRKFGIAFYDVRKDGAYILNLNEDKDW